MSYSKSVGDRWDYDVDKCRHWDKAKVLNCIRRNPVSILSFPLDTRYLHIAEEAKMLAVSMEWRMLENIKNPSAAVCKAAFERSGEAMCKLDRSQLTEEVVLLAVEQFGEALRFVPKELQSKAVVLAAVRQSGLALRYLDDDPEMDIVMEAVRQDGMALQFIKRQTNDMVAVAVRSNPAAIEFVMQQLPEDCKYAVERDGSLIAHVLEQSQELCMLAVKQYPDALEYIRKPTLDVVLEAVSRNGSVYPAVPDEWYENDAVICAAVQQYGVMIGSALNPTPKQFELALRNKNGGDLILGTCPKDKIPESAVILSVALYPETIAKVERPIKSSLLKKLYTVNESCLGFIEDSFLDGYSKQQFLSSLKETKKVGLDM